MIPCLPAPEGKETSGVGVELGMCPLAAQEMLSLNEVLPAAHSRNTPLHRLALHWNRSCVLVESLQRWRADCHLVPKLGVRSWQDLNHLWPLLHPHRNLTKSKKAVIILQNSAFPGTESEIKGSEGSFSKKHSHCQEVKLTGTTAIVMMCFWHHEWNEDTGSQEGGFSVTPQRTP